MAKGWAGHTSAGSPPPRQVENSRCPCDRTDRCTAAPQRVITGTQNPVNFNSNTKLKNVSLRQLTKCHSMAGWGCKRSPSLPMSGPINTSHAGWRIPSLTYSAPTPSVSSEAMAEKIEWNPSPSNSYTKIESQPFHQVRTQYLTVSRSKTDNMRNIYFTTQQSPGIGQISRVSFVDTATV